MCGVRGFTYLKFINIDAGRVGCSILQTDAVQYPGQSFLFEDLLLKEPKLAFHLITTLDFIHKVAMESINMWVQLIYDVRINSAV